MSRYYLQRLMVVSIILFGALNAGAHCEIPCGIYDDQLRVKMIAEHITTIEKSINRILELQKAKSLNYNQLTRWIMNKENHANDLQSIVAQYFLTQRIKIDAKDYPKKLVLLHKMLVYTMKCKQTTDLAYTEKLRALLREFSDLYFEKGHK